MQPMDTTMSEIRPITNLGEPVTQAGGNGKRFVFRHRRLGPSIGLSRLGCSVYVVPPGKRAFPYHAHAAIEEMFIILEGSGTLRHDGQEHAIRAGDVIAAPLGEAHQIVNTSQADLRYLAISSDEATDVVVYPDSGKLLAYAEAHPGTLRHVSRLADATDYYDGEK